MQSTPNLRDTDPHDVFVIEPDVSLAARADKASLDLLYDVLSRPSDPAPVRPDPELRIAPDFATHTSVPPVAVAHAPVADDIPANDIQLGETEISAHQPQTGRLARRAVMGLFALVSATGAAAWQHYGDDAKAMVANWTPPFTLASTPKPATTEPAPAVQVAADQITAPLSVSAQPAVNAAPAIAASEPTQQLQSMARDLAAMGQQISELKATIEQLKASQAQTASAPARTTEARLADPLVRPRIVPPPPAPVHAAVAPVRKPKQVFPYAPIAPAPPPPQQAAATAPVQIAPQAEDGGPVVRPPMPLH